MKNAAVPLFLALSLWKARVRSTVLFVHGTGQTAAVLPPRL
jgi:hypothetical protein